MGLFDRIKRAFTGEDVVQTPVTEENKIVIDKFDKGMEKTRKSFSEKMNELFAGFREVDEEFFDDLEETLISADVGCDMTLALSDVLRDEVKMKNVRTGEQVKNVIIEKLHFDQNQIVDYQKMIDQHRIDVKKNDSKILELKNELYQLLLEDKPSTKSDSIALEIGKIQQVTIYV